MSNGHRLTDEQMKDLAKKREAIHAGQASSRPLSKHYELIGLIAERQFSREFDVDMDMTLRPGGDGRVDFILSIGTVDVKGAARAYNLFREIDKPHAEILVLAAVNVYTCQAQLRGWELEEEMVKCPSKDFGYGITNHYKNAMELKCLDSLLEWHKSFLINEQGGFE